MYGKREGNFNAAIPIFTKKARPSLLAHPNNPSSQGDWSSTYAAKSGNYGTGVNCQKQHYSNNNPMDHRGPSLYERPGRTAAPSNAMPSAVRAIPSTVRPKFDERQQTIPARPIGPAPRLNWNRPTGPVRHRMPLPVQTSFSSSSHQPLNKGPRFPSYLPPGNNYSSNNHSRQCYPSGEQEFEEVSNQYPSHVPAPPSHRFNQWQGGEPGPNLSPRHARLPPVQFMPSNKGGTGENSYQARTFQQNVNTSVRAKTKSTTQKPTATPEKKKEGNSLRFITTSVQGVQHWLSITEKSPLMFEIFGRLVSPVISCAQLCAKEFSISDEKDQINCVFFEIDRSVPGMVRFQSYRFVGRYKEGRFQVLAIRPMSEDEERVYKLRINACERALRKVHCGKREI